MPLKQSGNSITAETDNFNPMNPLVTIVVPCFNEEKFIGNLLENILRQDYPRDRMEIFVIDGMSTDRTREIVTGYAAAFPMIRLLDNEKRYVPFALNLGIKNAKGDIFLRMDAHAGYPPDYVSSLIGSLEEFHADNAGGVWITRPAGTSVKAKAIAADASSPFGVGNALYRIGVREARKADTVPFGCYPMQVFDRIGMFDEELLRNQDDEFNARLIRNGGSIWLIPSVKIDYFPRNSVGATMKMFYQYGLFKPLVNRKIGMPATLRQLAPPLLVLLLAAIVPAFFIVPAAGYALLGAAAIYLLTDLFFTVQACVKNRSAALAGYLPWLYFLIHVAYGIGYITGIFRFLLFRWKPASISASR